MEVGTILFGSGGEPEDTPWFGLANALKQLYRLFQSKWDYNLLNEHHAVLKKALNYRFRP